MKGGSVYSFTAIAISLSSSSVSVHSRHRSQSGRQAGSPGGGEAVRTSGTKSGRRRRGAAGEERPSLRPYSRSSSSAAAV